MSSLATASAADARKAQLGNVTLAYHEVGPADGPPVLLLHGFASNARVNWFSTSWASLFVDAGFRVVAPDHRGHGASTKFHDPADYGPDIFANDAVALLDHLGIERADVGGFSMGARVAFALAAWHPERVGRVCLCGMGANIFGGTRDNEPIARALEADDPDTIEDAGAKSFRLFADRTGSDRLALAACIRPSRVRLTPDMAKRIAAPVLVAVGGDDEVSGPAEPLAAMIPGARSLTVPGRDHMRSTGDRDIKAAVLDFLRS